MLFSEPIFLFFFLPLVYCVHFIFCKMEYPKLHLFSLSLFSLTFYLWWSLDYIFIFISSIFVNYLFGIILEKKRKLTIISFGIITNLALLFYYKYSNFIFSSYFDSIALPLAISFFTFQQIAYLVDTFKGGAAEKNLSHFVFFVAFFPQLIAGPIVHHQDIRSQIDSKNYKNIDFEKVRWGVCLFLIGLTKKYIGDFLSPLVDYTFSLATNEKLTDPALAWYGAIAFYFQIYFDFSGYSDMARGLGWLFGVKMPINFKAPYCSSSLIDFWRNWHITLSHFLRDYLYIPLGGNRYGNLRRFTALIITMTLGGLWHGANYTFILWGFINGVVLVLTHIFRIIFSKKLLNYKKLTTIFGIIITNLMLIFLWVLFRSDSITTAKNYYMIMLKLSPFPQTMTYSFFNILNPEMGEGNSFLHTIFNLANNNSVLFYFLMFIILATSAMFGPISTELAETRKLTKLNFSKYLILSLVLLLYLIITMQNSQIIYPFIYFQF